MGSKELKMSEIMNNQSENASATQVANPVDMEVNDLKSGDENFINAKSYLLTASTKTGLNL